MKTLALLLSLLFLASPSEAAFSWYRTVTINHTLVPATQTNFPILFRSPNGTVDTAGTAVTLVSGEQFQAWYAGDVFMINAVVYTVLTVTDGLHLVLTGSAGVQSAVGYSATPYLATVANGGKVTDAQGDDIGWYTSSDCATGKMAWEIEEWFATNGIAYYWVNVASISSSVDTVIYLCYGDSSVTTDQSNRAGTWSPDGNFSGVWHLGGYPSTLVATNSVTGGASTVSGAVSNVGIVDGGAIFNGTTDVITTDLTSWTPPAQLTMEAWTYRTGDGGSAAARIFDTTSARGQLFNNSGDSTYRFLVSWTTTQGQWSIVRPSVSAIHSIVVTYNSGNTANIPVFYVDGSSVSVTAVDTPVGTFVNTSSTIYLGNRVGADRGFAGTLDEMRLSTTIRDSNYVACRYNNDFYLTFDPPGVETAVSAGGSAVSPFRALIGVGK